MFHDHNKKREYMHKFRPHTCAWNLFEDCMEEDRCAHILRHNADPTSAYIDGRVEKILANISELGINLMSYEKEKWQQLLVHTHEIFVHDLKIFKTELETGQKNVPKKED